MLAKLTIILIYSLAALFLGILLYPPYIKLLKKLKMGKTIREASVTGEKAKIFASLHAHKAWTPTMGWWMFILTVIIMLIFGQILRSFDFFTHSLVNQKETYMLIFGFFSMGLIGLVDDYFNIKSIGRVKGLSAKAKTIAMVIFAWFISFWFYVKLWVDIVYIWPLNLIWSGEPYISIGILFPLLSFLFIYVIVNAINITDWLDWLAWGMMALVLATLVVPAFFTWAYITTTLVAVVVASLLAFLWYNINPAKIFMGDSGSFALGGLLSTLVLTLNMRGISILVPFIILFALFFLEFWSSLLQILWKKWKKKKLFSIAPFHHTLEHRGRKETTVVMKFWFVQAILCAITLIMLFYQMI